MKKQSVWRAGWGEWARGMGCAWAVGFGAVVGLGQTNVLRLESALQIAVANDPELRAAGARVEAAAGRAAQAGQWSNPELELAAQEWPVSRGNGFADAEQTIGVAQTFPFPGKKSLERKAGTEGVRRSEAERAGRRMELIRAVKSAFCQVLAAERLAGVSAELVQVAESSGATARKRVEAGATPYQEQLRAEIQAEQARTELTGFQRQLAAVRHLLFNLIGRPDAAETVVQGTLPETARPELLDPAPSSWLARHPSAQAARAGVDRAGSEERRARLEPYPDVKVGLGGGRLGESSEAIVELRFSVPLPIVDRAKGRKQEARAEVKVAEAEVAAVEQRLRREWGQASQRYRAAAEQVATYRERLLPKANEALRLVQKGFEEGKFSFIDLLDTQRTTAEARLAYQRILLELALAQAELEALLGETPGPRPVVSSATPMPVPSPALPPAQAPVQSTTPSVARP